MHVTPSSTLSATRTPGKAPCRASIAAHATRRAACTASNPALSPASARGDLPQRPPHRRDGGDRAEQPGLVSYHPEVADHLGAVGNRARQIRQHPAPVMDHQPAPGQRLRQPAGQARPLSEPAQQHQAGVRHDPRPAAADFQPT
jgi:hypothetical protein